VMESAIAARLFELGGICVRKLPATSACQARRYRPRRDSLERACDPDSSAQARVGVSGTPVLNMCANNTWDSRSPCRGASGERRADRWGYGLSSVRFICGTQAITKSWRIS